MIRDQLVVLVLSLLAAAVGIFLGIGLRMAPDWLQDALHRRHVEKFSHNSADTKVEKT